MTINNKNISTFGGTLMGYDVVNDNIVVNAFDYDNTLQYYSTDLIAKQLVMMVFVEGNTRQEALNNVSLLLKEIQGESIIILDDNAHKFKCVFEQITKEKINANTYMCAISFRCVELGTELSVTATALTTTINNIGTTKSPLIIEITPKTNIASMTIGNITIKNLTTGKKVIIDGVKKTITENGLLKAKDVDFIEFPYLNSGTNTITVSNITPTIVFKYSPVYL